MGRELGLGQQPAARFVVSDEIPAVEGCFAARVVLELVDGDASPGEGDRRVSGLLSEGITRRPSSARSRRPAAPGARRGPWLGTAPRAPRNAGSAGPGARRGVRRSDRRSPWLQRRDGRRCHVRSSRHKRSAPRGEAGRSRPAGPGPRPAVGTTCAVVSVMFLKRCGTIDREVARCAWAAAPTATEASGPRT